MIKSKFGEQLSVRERYALMMAINPDSSISNLEQDKMYYSKLAIVNYYQSQYYDSISDYGHSLKRLRLSDNYKFKQLQQYQDMIYKNGLWIYSLIESEEKLRKANEDLITDKKLSRIYQYVISIGGGLLLVLVGFLFYFNKLNRTAKQLNARLVYKNEKLRVLDMERTEFFSVVSHELRTPIYGAHSMVSLMEKEDNDEIRAGYFNSLKITMRHISMLIDNMLQASRYKFEDKELIFFPHNIKELVSDICDSLFIFSHEKEVEFSYCIQPSLHNLILMIDHVALGQILTNLIYNSIKYTPKGKAVTVSLVQVASSEEAVSILFVLKDEGVGTYYDPIKKRYFSFDSHLKESNLRGSGLGLQIVNTLLNSYDSVLELISEVDQGTEFSFLISFKMGQSEEIDKAQKLNLGPLRVLVVDDNRLNLLIAQKGVEKLENATCTIAHSGQEGIDLACSNDYEVILMDINMPEMDGYQATKAIKQIKNIPIIAFTALNFHEVEQKAKEAGMCDVITKPFNFNDFEKIILSNINFESAKS